MPQAPAAARGARQLGGRWQRCRVVSRQARGADAYRVFLLDEGRSVCTSAHHLARGRPELFQLPSEVLGCVLADLVPPGGGELVGVAWPAGAADFLSCLQGKEVAGQVREVLLPQRLVVLELPWLLAQMQHLGLAQQAAPSTFRALLQRCLAPASALVPQPPPLPPATAAPVDYFYPRLQPGVTEPVLVTQVSDPQHIYCQLRSLSQEIRRLSDTMRQLYESASGRGQEQEAPSKPGSPCAARGIDGQWYRALLLEVFTGELGRPLAQVMCVDYGRKEFVTGTNLHRLPPECFRMPVLTYPCALQGVSDGGCGWSRSQLSELKTLLLGKAVSARIDAYSSFEHLYYVSLYGDNGINLNCLYGVQAHCLSASLLQGGSELPDAAAEEPEQPPGAPPAAAAMHRVPAPAARLPVVRLKAGVFCKGQVSFARDPGEFWLRLQEHKQPLGQLMRSMSDFYSRAQKLEAVLLEPQLGSLCCAKWKEKAYYRALVTRVLGKGVEVHLVDRGNTETLDWYEVKELLPQFMELPAVALKCRLADASPLGESWSKECVSYFKRAMRNKELTFHVLGTQGDKYVVEILDQSQTGEKNICKIMSWGGYAKFQGAEVPQVHKKAPVERLGQDPKWGAEEGKQASATDRRIEIEPKPKIDHTVLSSSAALVKDQPSDDLSDLLSGKGKMPLNLPCSFAQNYLEIKPGLSPYEDQLEVGSTVDVIVSCVESPGYFWCQLRRNSQELKKLMATIQDCCKDSVQPHYLPNPVCLAKYSEDEKWYRALILSGILPKEEVEVIYVDYGNKDVVSLKNLCSINADFLKLKAQAFRCSLYNLIQPSGPDPLVWDEEAISAFQEFVDASTECLQLNCTIFALAAVNNKELFNIVDLITPFESVCSFLIERGLARPVQPQSPLASSVQLYSYYYSTHDIKIGSEEEIYVTHVDDPWKFYFQLQRSADALEQLTDNIDQLNKVLACLKASQGSGNLCLAKYTDSHWYRGIVTKTKPNKEVYFVDFGNTEVVKKEDILPIPNDAYDILLLPMQAIKCSLSDISNVSEEATEWFTKAVLDKHLKAIIVAKESDGKLIIELYDGNIQINAKMKQDFSLPNSRATHRHPENETLRSKNQDAKEERNENVKLFTISTSKFTERENWRSEMQRGESSCKTSFICKEAKLLPSPKKRESLFDPWKGSVERFNSNKASPLDKVEESPLPIRKEAMGSVAVLSDTAGNRDQGENSVYVPLKNLSDLHQKNLIPGLKTLVYISHVNNLSDFYIQLASDESQLNSISETLNNGTRRVNLCKQQLKTGDLIGAAYSEDGLWYRAVIKEKSSEELISVWYIDYGNTSVVNISETCRLPEDTTLIPVMSIHCLLGGLQSVNCLHWTREAVLYFSERTSNVQINCEFVEKVKDKWKILLSDDQGMIAVDLTEKFAVREGSQLSEMRGRDESRCDVPNNLPDLSSDEQNKISHLNDTETFSWKIPEVGQTVEVYVTVVKGPGYFWCQIAGTESVNYMEEKLQVAGELSVNSMDDFRSGIKSGAICIVKSSEDEKFYRAEIRSIKGTSLIVRHVDYGTEEVVDREVVRQVPDELLAIPNQAFACRLSGFDSSEGSWISEIKDKFHDMIAESLLEITIIEIKKDNPTGIPLCSVKMQCNGVSINEELSCFWKPNLGNGDKISANIENMSEGKNESTGISNKDFFVLEEASSAAWSQVQKENQSAILDPELFHPTESDCLHTPKTPFLLEDVEVVLPTSNGEHQVKHQTSFETFGKESPLLENDSNSKIFLEPEIADVQVLFSSETKDLNHKPCIMEALDNVPQMEMLEFTVDGQSLSDTSEELLKLQSQYVQPSLGDEIKNLMELEHFQTQSSYDEIRDLLLELSSLEMQSSLDERTKDMLELEFLDEQLLGDETRDLVTQKSLEISPSLEERENLLELKSLEMQPSFADDREETLEPLPSSVQFSLVDEIERLKLDLDILQVHQMKSLAEEVLEMKSPQIPLLLDEAGKELEVRTHQAEIVLQGTMKEPRELVPSEVLGSLGDEAKDDVLELEESVFQLSANSIVQLSALKTDIKQGAVYSVTLGNVGLLDTKHEECAEQLSMQGTSSAEEQMKQGCHKAFKEYGDPYASGEPLNEETEIEKQGDSSVDHSAEQRVRGACNLEGFAVGSKCVVWTSPKWCEAQILEVTDEGTRVLNLSNGNEEIVNPENVWNGIPELARSPSEEPTNAADNLHPLSLDASVFQEKGTYYDSEVTSPCMAANIPEKASE
ncbi:PREDICTED: tudor domain-containing protein 6 [Crocodylus porosus]|uniref:tudor domain-containing protein 6 n=1 Tax=Crocodylus porosus TaxID=8502 RepID=UPI00093FA36A|nr:PREDICTED: tudor domain-containing protein 6 [Crocodylus porosus]